MPAPIPPQEHLACILDLAGMGLWDWDLCADVLTWHRALEFDDRRVFADLSGELPTNLEQFLTQVHPDDQARVEEAFDACSQGVLPCRCEYRARCGDTWRWVRSHGRLVRDEQGEPLRMHGFHMDVHSRRSAQEALARSRDELDRRVEERTQAIRALEVRHEAILRGAPDGIITIDKTGTIESANPAAEKLFGYADGELVDRRINDLMPSPYQGEHDGYLERYLRTGEAKIIGIGREVTGKQKDGTTFPIHLEVSELALPTGIVFIGIMRDISARMQAEMQLRETAARLAQSNEDLDDFAYIASHDLKEPLRGISNYASFVLEDFGPAVDAEGQRMLGRIVHLSERLEDLIDSLLQYSRVSRTDNQIQATDLNLVVHDVIDSMSTAAEEHNAEIAVPATLPTVLCDPVRTAEVFRNLIGNGLKYTRAERPHIEITASVVAGLPVFCVADNGIGIAQEHHERIFGMFHRLHGREDFGGGTGIGLPLVQKIVERHGGRIWLESEVGRGTRFMFTLAPQPQDWE